MVYPTYLDTITFPFDSPAHTVIMGNTISSMGNSTVVGWAIILSLVAYAASPRLQQYLKPRNQDAAPRGRAPQRPATQVKKENKAKRQRMESFANESKQNPSKASASVTSAPDAKPGRDIPDDDVDNRAFAQQMARNKQSKFAPKANVEQKQKSIKQSKAKEISRDAEAGKVSSPSSTTGADADDDQSPTTSPSLAAADATGVSDMLEQAAPGPSVLRLIGAEEKQPLKPKKAASPQPTETKKQRQNRKKREQEKALREEDEKERKVKLEQQRRAAREAEGRAAKDGSAFMAAQKPSVWTENTANGSSVQKTAPAVHQPLDTFDSTPKAAAAAPPAKVNGKESGKASSKQNGAKVDWADIPYSEEEQIAMLQKQDDMDWVPVKSRKTKKTSNPGVANSETSESANEAAAPATTQVAAKTKSEVTNGRPKPQTMSTQSSFAALHDDGADLEEEREWDV